MRLRSTIAAATFLGCAACAQLGGSAHERAREATALTSVTSEWIRNLFPETLRAARIAELEIWQWLGLMIGASAAFAVALGIERVLLGIGRRMAEITPFEHDDRLVQAARGPLRLLLSSLLLVLLTRWLAFPETPQFASEVVARTAGIASVAWFVLRFLDLLGGWILKTLVSESPTDLSRMRGLRTQVTVLRRVLQVASVVVAVAAALMQFDVVRSVGVSLLASAGLAGLLLGFAAQKSIATLLAGIQLSITQPIRIGDAVMVEKEFGFVEEVRLTYVVVKLWDLRRMVVPITYFLEQPFQNWSKVHSELLGVVELRADYSTDVEGMRAELKRILETEGKALWDGRTQVLQVTDATDRAMVLRALVSAADPAKLFDLRCLVRERLIGFLSAHRDWLPIDRNETVVRPSDGTAPSAAQFLPARKEDRPLNARTGSPR
jgi:small-conductance mechanosensitive channel